MTSPAATLRLHSIRAWRVPDVERSDGVFVRVALLEVEDARGEKVYGPDSMCVAVARMGQDDELIKSCTLKEMCNIDMGGPLHSMVLVGETHPLENDMLAMHRAKDSDFLPEDQVPSQYLDDM